MSNFKSSREWLLARHAPMEPKLDLLRRGALPGGEITWRELARELIRPYGALWRALAIIWVILVAVHYTQAGSSKQTSMGPPPPEAMAASSESVSYYETLTQIDHQP